MAEQPEWEIELNQIRQLMRNDVAGHGRIRDRVLRLQERYYDGEVDGNINWERWACDRFAYNLKWLRFVSSPHPLTLDVVQRRAQEEREKLIDGQRKFDKDLREAALSRYEKELKAAAKLVDVQYGDEIDEKAVKKAKKAQAPKPQKPLPLAPLPPAEAAVPHLNACGQIERRDRVELGREYHAMRELAQNQMLGRDDDGRYWTWMKWSAIYVRRSRSDIKACIALYMDSLSDGRSSAITQSGDVDPGNVVALPRNGDRR